MALEPFQEQLSGVSVSGQVSAFHLAHVPMDNTLLFFINGVYQTINVDYSLSAQWITISSSPDTYDYRAAYTYQTSEPNRERREFSEVLTNNAASATSLFTTTYEPIADSLNVFVNGIAQTPNPSGDYNLIGNNIGFNIVLPVGYIVTVNYDYWGVLPSILPEGIHGSTTLNPIITAYDPLLRRIKRSLGWPVIEIEICDEQVYEFINIAIEWYSKYAGLTEEFLVFSSDLYREPGLKIDDLFSLTPTMRQTLANGTSASWDYDLQDYRKVAGIFEFQQGETTGINTLFTLEQAMAQQTYFSYMLGNVGFDLVTWECLKGWLDLRSKVLAQIPYIDFDVRTQLLRIIPPPNRNSRYYGVVGCWVERAIKDLIRERWVYQYALALTKIAIGNIRGKYGSVQMFGGGVINYNDLLSQGLQEKESLEKELMQLYGEVTPARFWIG